MSITAKQKKVMNELKKKIRSLQKSQEQTTQKLHTALSRAHELARVYQNKLAKKSNEMQRKLKEMQDSSYARAFSDLQKEVKKDLRTKAKALVSILCQLDKKRKPAAKRKKTRKK